MTKITSRPFGTVHGKQAILYTLDNGIISADITDYGAALTALRTMSRSGETLDVLLGYESAEQYSLQDGYLGATVGRCCNRIAGGSFWLGGTTYCLYQNDGKNHLHGGRLGFSHRFWQVEVQGEALCFSLHSPDGEEGYPGALEISVCFSLTEQGGLLIRYRARSSRDTLCNLTNHAYFNLDGQGCGRDVLGHQLRLCAERYTPCRADLVPAGELRRVSETPYDFTEFHAIGERIACGEEGLEAAGGYDHNWELEKEGLAAEAYSPYSGVCMQVYTDRPGMQFYSGNFLTERMGKAGAVYGKRSGFCLETQCFPDAIHRADFPSPILKAGEEYRTYTEYRFSVLK